MILHGKIVDSNARPCNLPRKIDKTWMVVSRLLRDPNLPVTTKANYHLTARSSDRQALKTVLLGNRGKTAMPPFLRTPCKAPLETEIAGYLKGALQGAPRTFTLRSLCSGGL